MQRHVRLFRNGRNQAVRIPVEFELQGTEAIIRREGNSLVIEPVGRPTLRQVLAGFEPLDLPDLPVRDEGLLPARDVDL